MMAIDFPYDAAIIANTLHNDSDPNPTKTLHPHWMATPIDAVFLSPSFLRVPEMMMPTVLPQDVAIVTNALPNESDPVPA